MSTDNSGEIEIWDTDAQSIIRRLCKSVGDTLTAAQWAQYAPSTSFPDPCQSAG